MVVLYPCCDPQSRIRPGTELIFVKKTLPPEGTGHLDAVPRTQSCLNYFSQKKDPGQNSDENWETAEPTVAEDIVTAILSGPLNFSIILEVDNVASETVGGIFSLGYAITSGVKNLVSAATVGIPSRL